MLVFVKTMLALAGTIVIVPTSLIVFYLARKRLKVVETSKSKAHVFYRMIAGMLMGHVIGHIFVLNAQLMTVFVALGYFLLDMADTLGRAFNANANIVGPSDHSTADDVGLNRTTMETESVVVADDISSDAFAEQVFVVDDNWTDVRKRQWMLFTLISLLTVVCFMDGLQLIYSAPDKYGLIAAMIICYYVHVCSMSVTVFGAMIHAKYHTTENFYPHRRIIWWGALTFIWFLIVTLSAIPTMIGMSKETALFIALHPAVVAFYGMASGVLLRLQQYYGTVKLEASDRKELLLGSVILFASLFQSILTSQFL